MGKNYKPKNAPIVVTRPQLSCRIAHLYHVGVSLSSNMTLENPSAVWLFVIGKSDVNGACSTAIFDCQRVLIKSTYMCIYICIYIYMYIYICILCIYIYMLFQPVSSIFRLLCSQGRVRTRLVSNYVRTMFELCSF